jgi:hypothetical protein
MPTAKLVQPGAINKSLEMGVERNVHKLKRTGATSRQTGDGNHVLLSRWKGQ